MKKERTTTTSTGKIHVVIGTKAQLIKMGPVMAELERNGIAYNFIFTGQHQETIQDLRKNFQIKEPDIILHHGKDITSIFSMAKWLTKILFQISKNKKKIFGETSKSDLLLTHGDTFSTLLGALMGKLAKVKVAHVESGLRSFNLFNPFPEEITRKLTFNLSDYYFCPGEWAVENLHKYQGQKINTIQNTLFDALKLAVNQGTSEKVSIPKEKYFVASIHRFENIFKKKRFQKIVDKLLEIAEKSKILFILHPVTLKQLKKFDLYKKLAQNPMIELRPRYDYFDFINLLHQSELMITDGGSNQEECFYLGKPCLLFRSHTERKEGLDQNVVISNFEDLTIDQFIDNYNQHRIARLDLQKSPSKIIIDHVIKITNNNENLADHTN